MAAGHEGSGLTLGPATVKLIMRYFLGHKDDKDGGPPTDAFADLLPERRLAA